MARGSFGMDHPQQIVIIGGGVASLTAGIEILEQEPAALVTLLTGDTPATLGGHLAAWDEHGFPVEHGLHALFGFYDHALPLFRRLGIMESFTRSPGHVNVYERGRLHRFHGRSWPLTYRGFDVSEKASLVRFAPALARLVGEALRHGLDALDAYDAWDFRDYLRGHGVSEAVLQSNFFRALYDGPFNTPGPMAASCGLEGLYRILSRPWHYYFNGPSSDCLIDPLRQRFTTLGGTVEFESRALRVCPAADGRRVASIVVESRDGLRELQPDHLVVAVGLDAFKALDWGGLGELPYITRVDRLDSVSSLSLQAWFHDDPFPPRADALMVGLPEPLTIVCPSSVVRRGGVRHPVLPHELIATGAEAGFESEPDDAIIEGFFRGLRRLGFRLPPRWTRDPDRAGADAAYVVFRRNDRPSHRYMAPRPGQLAARPDPVSPLENLFVAGAWAKASMVLPCVDTAVETAQAAASASVQQLRAERAPTFVGMPRFEPLVLAPPYDFRDVLGRFAWIDADEDAVLGAIPQSLEAVAGFSGSLVVAALEHREVVGRRDPSRSRYSYREVVVAAVARPRGGGAVGLFPLTLYVDDDVALAAGREVYGYPKKLARIDWSETGCEVVRPGRPMGQHANEAFVEPTLLMRLSWDRPADSPMTTAALRRLVAKPIVFHTERSLVDPRRPDRAALQEVVSLPMTEVRPGPAARIGMGVELFGSAQDPLARLVPRDRSQPTVRAALRFRFGFTMDRPSEDGLRTTLPPRSRPGRTSTPEWPAHELPVVDELLHPAAE